MPLFTVLHPFHYRASNAENAIFVSAACWEDSQTLSDHTFVWLRVSAKRLDCLRHTSRKIKKPGAGHRRKPISDSDVSVRFFFLALLLVLRFRVVQGFHISFCDQELLSLVADLPVFGVGSLRQPSRQPFPPGVSPPHPGSAEP